MRPGSRSAWLAALVAAGTALVWGLLAQVAAARLAQTAPSTTVSPVIAGTPAEGQTLVATAGSWSGDTPLSYAYQWEDCTAQGACTPINGATGQSYVVAASDLGSELVVSVTATNDAGSGVALSAPTAVATAGMPPLSTAQPATLGAFSQGSTLTVSAGSWSGDTPLSFAYQWQRCTGATPVCIDIPAATGPSYVLAAADVGSTVRVLVTASNDVGEAQVASTPTGVVSGSGPTELAPPAIDGAPVVGQALDAQPGSWSGEGALGYTYQWQRCSSATACSDIAGATAASYTPVGADLGASLRVLVTAGNGVGSAQASSGLSPLVEAAATSLPTKSPVKVKTTTPSGDPFHARRLGVDVSFPDCGSVEPRVGAFVIVGLNDGLPFSSNPCFTREYGWSSAHGAPTAVYLNTSYSSRLLPRVGASCRRQGVARRSGRALDDAYALGCSEATASLARASRAAPAVIWLDVEPSNPWSTDRALNRATIEGMFATLAQRDPRATIGIYSDPRWWEEITGGLSSPTAPEWMPALDNAVCRQSFAGGPVWLAQGGSSGLDLDRAC